MLSLLLSISLLGLGLSSPLPPPPSRCKDVVLTVSGTATNRVVKETVPVPGPATLQQLLSFVEQPVILNNVSGTYHLFGEYCEPTIPVQSRANTLQLLVHGNEYDHRYWSALGTDADEYSWVAFANSQGYPTLAIDRLGVGQSDHPDPNDIVQAPFQVALLTDLVNQLRNNPRLPVPSLWNKIIWVAHSYGCILGSLLSTASPEIVDAYVQTGIAVPLKNESRIFGQVLVEWAQASFSDPADFPPQVDVSGYFVATSFIGRRNSFFSDPATDFSEDIYDADWKVRGTITPAEGFQQVLSNSTEYSGPLFVLNGEENAIWCGNGSRLLSDVSCGEGPTSQLAAVKDFYPQVPADKFGFYAQPNSGHSNLMHYTAPLGMYEAHEFLRKQGF